MAHQLVRTSTHTVEHLRRGLYRLVVFHRCPNPNGTHLVAWYRGNKRGAFRYLDRLLALPASFRGSGAPLPPQDPPAPAPLAGATGGAVAEPPPAYHPDPPRLALGRVVATRGALGLALSHGLDLSALLGRHASGDWGDVCAADAQANDLALDGAARLLSAYDTAAGRLWIITEADRSATTVLLPSEY